MRHESAPFHPRKFIHNNIDFRTKTSDAISMFKAGQSFVLKQMAHNTKFEFSLVSKDIMLLKYDVWYDWLNEVEQILLTSCESREEIKKDILESAKQRKKYYENTLLENFTGRDLEIIKTWINIHEKIYHMLEEKILDVSDSLDIGDLFFEIARFTSSILRRTLYELQELETVFFDRGDVNLCVDNICMKLFKKSPDIILEKIDIYLKIKKFNKVIIKNYSDIEELEIVCDRMLKELQKRNIEYYII